MGTCYYTDPYEPGVVHLICRRRIYVHIKPYFLLPTFPQTCSHVPTRKPQNGEI
jgi:hypothetical protein